MNFTNVSRSSLLMLAFSLLSCGGKSEKAAPAAMPIVTSFVSETPQVTCGTATTLTAVFSGGTATVDHGIGNISSGTPNSTGPISESTVYTLTVTNSEGKQATSSVAVNVVPAPVIIRFAAARESVTTDDSTTLSAEFSGGTARIDQGIGEITSGAIIPIGPLKSSCIYTLTVTNALGASVTASLLVAVIPAPVIISFSPTKSTLTIGETTTLSYAFSGGTGVISEGIGTVVNGGTSQVAPSTTTIYALTVTNEAGACVTATTKVTVENTPNIKDFFASNTVITEGDTTTLNFTTSGGSAVISEGIGPVPPGGMVLVMPHTTTTYILTVTNGAGTQAISKVTITVVRPPIITRFEPTKRWIASGESVDLITSFSDGTGTISPSIGEVTSGIAAATGPLTMTTTYELKVCNAAGASVTATTTIIGPTVLACGNAHTVALQPNGTVLTWGGNNALHAHDSIDACKPEQVAGLTDVVAVAAGGSFSLALKRDGTVWAWGSNNYGQLGNGTNRDCFQPTQILLLNNIVSISAGNLHSMALRSDGTVYAWGCNESGQLGDGSTTNRYLPTRVRGIRNVVSISCGLLHNLALASNGTVWAWGENLSGQIGIGILSHSEQPIQIPNLSTVTNIACGSGHSLAVKCDGSAWAWGDNVFGQLGVGSTTNHLTPTQIINLTGVVTIYGGRKISAAITTDGSIKSWGSNSYGQLGIGTDGGTYSTPTSVISASFAVAFASGMDYCVSLHRDGQLLSWGSNSNGQLGDGSITYQNLPCIINNISNTSILAASAGHSYAIASNGNVFVWGSNESLSLGMPSVKYASSPLLSPHLKNVKKISAAGSYAMALMMDGTLSKWGTIPEINGFNRYPLPTDVNTSQIFNDISVGPYHFVALSIDGSLWSCGNNSSGELGLGNYISTPEPQKIPFIENIIEITTGSRHSLALKLDGTVWAWGDNTYGALANSTLASSPKPIIINLPQKAKSICAGYDHCLALLIDGSIYSWGRNHFGQLGDGSLVDRNYPLKLTAPFNAVAIKSNGDCSFAITQDGMLWSWGANMFGQLGIGNFTNQSSPVHVSSLHNVREIAPGGYHTLARSDESVYAWGADNCGTLATGRVIQRNTPGCVIKPQ